MSILSSAGNLLGDATGLTEGAAIAKAKIYVYDVKDALKTAEYQILQQVSTTNNKDLNMQMSLQKIKAQEQTAQAKKKLNALQGIALAGGSVDLQKEERLSAMVMNKVETRSLEVQFNPSTLHLSGYGGGQVVKTTFGKNDNGMSYEEADAHIDFSVQLIFDQTNYNTAFMDGAREVTLSRVASAGVSAIKNKVNGSTATVKQQVEAFNSIVRNAGTRLLSFVWGPMSYSGIVNGINTQYTMFDQQGEPTRATVSFNMICYDKSLNSGTMGVWADNYRRAFNEDKKYSTGGQLLKSESWLNL